MQVRFGLRRGGPAGGAGEIAIHKDAPAPAPAHPTRNDPQRPATTRNDPLRSVQSEGRAEDPVQYPSDGKRPQHPKRSQ